ncbi:pseudouridine synthase [uncultured Porphyromonas sp.]|uniref:pseudouridine synthase n=1 Tax=uncultured Porphyromonas sp. TaxID=159274 RepID=UPI0025CE3197|nr:pseudouridine synthase [uncultured Porphyromonas sp.]
MAKSKSYRSPGRSSSESRGQSKARPTGRSARRLASSVNTSPSQESYSAEEQQSLLDLIITKSGRSRTATKRLISSGRVSVAETPTTMATQMLEPGTAVTVHRLAPVAPFAHPLISVEWEDDSYVVVYKKTGIPTVNTAHKDPRNTVLHILSRHYKKSNPAAKLFMLSRLDKSSAGFVVFAKTTEAKELLSRRWSSAVHHQRYALVVEGTLPTTEPFELTSVSTPSEDERKGRTSARTETAVRAEVQPLTSSAGGNLHLVEADVVGVRIYSMRKIFGDNKLRIFGDIRYHSHFYAKDQIALAQTELELTMPHTGETLRLRRPIPSHFRTLLAQDKGQPEE